MTEKNKKHFYLAIALMVCLALILFVFIKTSKGGNDNPTGHSLTSAPTAENQSNQAQSTEGESSDSSSSETTGANPDSSDEKITNSDEKSSDNVDLEKPEGIVCENGICVMPNNSD